MKNKKACSPKRRGFTIIEILIVVAIIAILAAAVMVSIGESRKKARINSAKTSLKTALTIIISCNDSSGAVNPPNASESGANKICPGINGAFWPKLGNGYQYITSPAGNYTSNCKFKVDTNGDSADLNCDCVKQNCQ
ncbi:MAG: prepilin-type N-terminal cleavage/methylation domain-containing protein [Parcubacteria group bacterium]